MARRGAARTERFVPVAVVTAGVLLLDTLSVLERISAAVCIPFPTCLLYRLLTTAGFLFVRLAAGYTCYRDSANSPKCSLPSTYTITTSTSTSTIRKPTSTSTSPLPTKTPDSDDSSDDSLPDDNSNSDSTNTNSLNSSSSTSSSSTSRPSPSGLTSSTLNGATGWKGSSGYVGLAPFFVLIGTWLW